MIETWTVLKCLKWTTDYLQQKGVENPRLDSEYLLADMLQFSRVNLYLQFDRPLSETELKGFRQRVQRRAKREPVQYILGNQKFHEVEVDVGPGVLIPRPETEILVEEVLKVIPADCQENFTVLEIGTGSANIPLALVRARPKVFVDTVELSSDAYQQAKKNVEKNSQQTQIQIWLGKDFDCDGVQAKNYDLILSNPPYIAQKAIEGLAPEVSQYEPRMALDGGDDGLDLIRILFEKAPQFLKPGGFLFIEVGADQEKEVLRLAERKSNGNAWLQARVIRDLNDRPRVFSGKLSPI